MKRGLLTWAFMVALSFCVSLMLWSIPPTSAQFVDRLVRPCQTGGTSGTVQVTTTNILLNPCPGGSVTINGTAIMPGGLPDPGSNGYVVRTAANTTIARTFLAGTGLGVTFGDGVGAATTYRLLNTTVTPGAYTNANITIDQQGRITTAANGSGFTCAACALNKIQKGNGAGNVVNADDGNDTIIGSNARTNTASNTDLAGQLTIGAGGTVTFTFVQTYTSGPACVCSDTNATPSICGASATTTTLTLTGAAGNVVNYICIGRN